MREMKNREKREQLYESERVCDKQRKHGVHIYGEKDKDITRKHAVHTCTCN